MPLYQPVAGCSEIINLEIVKLSGYEGWAQSCLRSKKEGEVCGRCWKCFRKNSLLGIPFEYTGEIEKFLQKRPLKQAVSTLYAIQKMGNSKNGMITTSNIDDINHLLEKEYDWLERFYPPSLDLLPLRYKQFTEKRLTSFAKKMNLDDIRQLQSLDMFPEEDSKEGA